MFLGLSANATEPGSDAQVAHLQADAAIGPYTYLEHLFDGVSPQVVEGPDGQWAVYYRDIQSAQIKMSRSGNGPAGPWSEAVTVLSASINLGVEDTTFFGYSGMSGVIRDDGSLLGMYSPCEQATEFGTVCTNPCCHFPHIVTASNWEDPSTYQADTSHRAFKSMYPFGATMPSLWAAGDVVHALLHDRQCASREDCLADGRHAFSDGTAWGYAATNAFGPTVTDTDGNTVTYTLRTDPSVVLNEKGVLTHLVTTVKQQSSADRWTLIQSVVPPQSAILV